MLKVARCTHKLKWFLEPNSLYDVSHDSELTTCLSSCHVAAEV